MPTKHSDRPTFHHQNLLISNARKPQEPVPVIAGPANYHEAGQYFPQIPISIFRKSPGKLLRRFSDSGFRLLNHSKLVGYVMSVRAMDDLYGEHLELRRKLQLHKSAIDQATRHLFQKRRRTELEETLLHILSFYSPEVTANFLNRPPTRGPKRPRSQRPRGWWS